jgi:predicted nucleic acid-binding protein
MPVYYFDTSALVKHYHAESGTSVVDAILGNSANRVIIGRVGLTETISALTRLVRIGEVPANSLPRLLRGLRHDIAAKRFSVIRMLQPHFASAEKIISTLGATQQIRTLDALHLSVALAVHQEGGIAGFVCSDQRLILVAVHQGMTVIDPQSPPAGFVP